MKWSDQDDEELIIRWNKGESAAVIASYLLRSRSAILGRAHRLKLPKHETLLTTNPRSVVARAPASPPKLKPVPIAPVLLPVAPPRDKSQILTIYDLEKHHCRWPTSHVAPNGLSFIFCGDPIHGDGLYCSTHKELSYTAPADRRRTA